MICIVFNLSLQRKNEEEVNLRSALTNCYCPASESSEMPACYETERLRRAEQQSEPHPRQDIGVGVLDICVRRVRLRHVQRLHVQLDVRLVEPAWPRIAAERRSRMPRTSMAARMVVYCGRPCLQPRLACICRSPTCPVTPLTCCVGAHRSK